MNRCKCSTLDQQDFWINNIDVFSIGKQSMKNNQQNWPRKGQAEDNKLQKIFLYFLMVIPYWQWKLLEFIRVCLLELWGSWNTSVFLPT